VDTNTGLKSNVILGYRIIERIGSGGYGEVWKAEAPGGLLKAIKILYGYHDERRAQSELKALDRVKQLRHPFLLSLERIEVVDGQLIVITELADRSLADLFDVYAEAGQPGIPRDELLRYLDQAAQALDYLATDHKLQHLDVKPENLLLVGQHVKLADFGLVKDLQHASQSLLGGMTPNYAPPELFDGRPTSTSDQYSLAIVYQEMLTGERPIQGNSPAHIASQHMHGKPNLKGLPSSDQPAIARALSKDPNRRFPTCKAMVDELSNRKSLVKSGKKSIAPVRKGVRTTQREIRVKLQQWEFGTENSSTNSLYPKPQIKFVDPPTGNPASMAFSPTIFIAVGKMGTHVLQRLKQRIEQQIGPLDGMPALQLLCLDSDRNQLAQAEASDPQTRLTSRETLLLPLRRPEEYRDRAKVHTSWLNRRWIYNVPKTLQTEGFRPLGRLAFVDHFGSIWDRLNNVLDHSTKPESIAATLQRLEMLPGGMPPRVFIVSSISGGIGSGLTLDLAYATKMMLVERGFSPNQVFGILMHGANSRQSDTGLTVANSFAFLTEMRQYMQDGYPGDASCGMPEMIDEPPFDHPYLVDLGTNKSETELDDSLSTVADYLFLNSLSPCQSFLDLCRELPDNDKHFTFRSFGVSSLGLGFSPELHILTDLFIDSVLVKWTDLSDSRQEPTGVNPWLVGQVVLAGMVERFEQELCNQLTTDMLEGAISSAVSCEESDAARTRTSWRQAFDQIFGVRDDRESGESGQANPAIERMELVHQAVRPIAKEIEELVIGGFKTKRLLLAEIERVRAEIQCWSDEQRLLALEQAASLEKRLCDFESAITLSLTKRKDINSQIKVIRGILQGYAGLRLTQLATQCATDYFRALQRRCEDLKTECERIRLRLTAAAQMLDSQRPKKAELPESEGCTNALLQLLMNDSESLLAKIELRLFHDAVQPRGTFWDIVQDPSCVQTQLLPALETAARIEIREAGKAINIDPFIASQDKTSNSHWVSAIQGLAKKCVPLMEDCGGDARTLVAVPRDSSSSKASELIQDQLGSKVATTRLTTGDLIVVSEVENICPTNFAMNLLSTRSDCVELAKRLHTRNDVSWTSLEDVL
jgi:serine/threonine protein kinase